MNDPIFKAIIESRIDSMRKVRESRRHEFIRLVSWLIVLSSAGYILIQSMR